jgi:hypothetical protein
VSGITFKYKNAGLLFATAAINWATAGATVRCILVGAGYSPQSSDQFLSAIPAGAIVADVALTSTAVRANGTCYGAIPPFNSLLSPQQIVGMVLYISTGNPATSPLIYFSNQGAGFPFTAQGFNYFVTYDQLAGGWFQE